MKRRAHDADPPSGRHHDALLLVAGGARPELALPVLTESEWVSFVDAAQFHGLTALAHRFLQAAGPVVPPFVADALAAGYRDSARRALLLAAWLCDVVSRLDAAAIPAIVLKGPPLAQKLYSDPALRPSFDLDILVRPSDVGRTFDLLAVDGYAPPPHLARFSDRVLLRLDGEVVVQHPHRTPIDLHWAIAPADYPFQIDPGLFWRCREQVEIAGRPVPALTSECLLLYLAAHGAKHGWARLLWLSDIARLSGSSLDWQAVMRLAAEARCTRLVHVAVLLVRDLLNAPLPGDVISAASADPSACRGAAAAAARLRRVPPRELSTIERTAFNAGLATSVLAKARHWAAIVVTPKDEDLARWRLAERFVWLYRPLRVQRLVRKYGRRLLRF
jgi:hypothetical protein